MYYFLEIYIEENVCVRDFSKRRTLQKMYIDKAKK